MSETKWTKGEWVYSMATGEILAKQECGDDITVMEADAMNPWDGRLSAQAPILYTELQDLIGLAENAMRSSGKWSEPEIEAELAPKRAALSKARGEHP
jgi:hypothetical protein